MNRKVGVIISEPLTKQEVNALIKACLSEGNTSTAKRNKSDRKRNRKDRWR